MIKLLSAVAFFTIACAYESGAQKNSDYNATYAYARGNDSYVRFSPETYDASKKYVVFKLWNESEVVSDEEKNELEYLKKQLGKINVEVVPAMWRNEEELKTLMKKYGLEAEAKGDKHITIHAEHFNMNTTSGKAFVVLEDGKPVSICSGKGCDDNLKVYFKLQSFN